MEENNKKAVFKEYNYSQGELFPQNISEWIPENHLVRIVDKIIESIDITPIIDTYPGGGCSSYHPKMMLKVIIYAYCEKIYSSRKIDQALKENINFIWISGRQTPDFRTINRFRLKLKKTIKKIFFRIIKFLLKNKYIKFENYFLDGTKVEANANKYTFVWKKATDKYKKLLVEKINAMFENIDKINKDEDISNQIKDSKKSEITSKALLELKKTIDESLKKEPDKELKKISKKIEKDYLPRLEKYENYEETFGNRNSFSKTDKDATFMRMKEDHMLNGQLKAGYNVQIGTENQFVLNYDIHQKPTDTTTLIPHFEGLKDEINIKPENVVADAGYGSEENYEYLKNEKMNGYVKYNTFRIEDTKKFKKDIFKKENFKYDKEKNEYECPNGKKLKYIFTKNGKTENGFETKHDIYECEDCSGCNLKQNCTKSKTNRRIAKNDRLDEFKKEVKMKLNTEKGIELRKKRSVEVESVFGHIKSNRGFNRFKLRGIEKVSLEWGLLSIAHNCRKVWVYSIIILFLIKIYNQKSKIVL